MQSNTRHTMQSDSVMASGVDSVSTLGINTNISPWSRFWRYFVSVFDVEGTREDNNNEESDNISDINFA